MKNIKRIIFDLDNTVIIWNDKYLEGIKKASKEYNLFSKYKDIDNTLLDYEDYYSNYSIENLQEHIKNKIDIDVSKDFINTWLKYVGEMSEENKEFNDTLEYLSKKYELVILTNYFKDVQVERLKNAKCLNYFKEVYGGDKYIKPNKESFIEAMNGFSPNECLMVGDTYEIDIMGAKNVGMKAIHVQSKKVDNEVITIKDITELKNIL